MIFGHDASNVLTTFKKNYRNIARKVIEFITFAEEYFKRISATPSAQCIYPTSKKQSQQQQQYNRINNAQSERKNEIREPTIAEGILIISIRPTYSGRTIDFIFTEQKLIASQNRLRHRLFSANTNMCTLHSVKHVHELVHRCFLGSPTILYSRGCVRYFVLMRSRLLCPSTTCDKLLKQL
uniref:Uncharacterized protein n=1 Tax=Glossina pallidipes TaxID=7398 RepID=A0A1A9ZST0_GLOPL